MATILLVVVSLLTVHSALAARIIGITGQSSGSHYFVVRKAMEELSSRGHEVCIKALLNTSDRYSFLAFASL